MRQILLNMAAFCVLTAVLLPVVGCSRKHPPTKEGATPAAAVAGASTVAIVGGTAITVEDLAAYLAERPVSAAEGEPAAATAGRLDELILQEVLVQEALRLRLDEDQAVRRSIRQLLAQALMSRESGEAAGPLEVSESEIQEHYTAHREEFDHPAQVRLADIFIAVPPDAPAEVRAERRKRAETALTEVLAARAQRSGFAALVSQYSDTHPSYPKGDTGFFDTEGSPRDIDRSLARAALSIRRVGDTLAELVEEPAGYHIIMLTGKRAAVHEPLQDVRPQLARTLAHGKARKQRADFVARLREQADVTVNRDLLAGFAAGTGTTMPPGVPGGPGADPPAPRGSRAAAASPGPQE